MTKRRTVTDWLKLNPLAVVAGGLTTVLGLIASVGTVGPIILKALNLPDCLSYAELYHSPDTNFKREGDYWREYPREGGEFIYEFRELNRTRDNIDLKNLTDRPYEPRWRSMIVRLPVCGGTAKMSFPPPERWEDLYQVWRD